jgi:hypothetical protein
MSAGQEVVPDFLDAVKHRIVQRTAGRIRKLEVLAETNRIEVCGEVVSFHLKQMAIQAVVEEMNS